MAEMQRLTKAFVEDPDSILQQLIKGAVDLCEADSAGISIEKEDKTDESFYHWIAISGDYSGFLNAVLPRFPAQHRNEAPAAPARNRPTQKNIVRTYRAGALIASILIEFCACGRQSGFGARSDTGLRIQRLLRSASQLDEIGRGGGVAEDLDGSGASSGGSGGERDVEGALAIYH
jgi:hypothetical protein